MNPIVLFENLIEDATLSVTSEASGYPKENLQSRLPFKTWKGSSSADQTISITLGAGDAATGIGIYNHNLGTIGAQVALDYNDAVEGWTNATTLNPANDDIILDTFAGGGAQTEYRVVISSISAAPEIGILFVGSYLEFPDPPATPFVPAVRSVQSKGEVNKNGQMLGVDVSVYPVQCDLRFSYLTRSWVSSNLLPFYEDYLREFKPFFYAPDIVNLTDDVYFVRFNGELGYSTPLSLLTYVDEVVLQFVGVE